jgi:hypothetical protein
MINMKLNTHNSKQQTVCLHGLNVTTFEKNLEFKYLKAPYCFFTRIFALCFHLPAAKFSFKLSIQRLKLICVIRLGNGSINSKHIVIIQF